MTVTLTLPLDINEIFRQMTITLTLPLDAPARPMDARGLIVLISRQNSYKRKYLPSEVDPGLNSSRFW